MSRKLPHRSVPGVAYPHQARGWETFERLLDAAEEQLVDVDFESLTVEDVLARANVSNGSFYARFDSKEALLGALLERYVRDVEESLERLEASVEAGARLEERARAFVESVLRRFQKRRGMLRVISLHYRIQAERGVDIVPTTRRANRRIQAFFRPVHGEVGHPDPDRAVLRGTYFVAAIVRERILFRTSPHASSVPLPVRELQEELAFLLTAYLRG